MSFNGSKKGKITKTASTQLVFLLVFFFFFFQNENDCSVRDCCLRDTRELNWCQDVRSSMGDNPYNVAVSRLISGVFATAKP